ncbi:MAG: hypothetical protein KKA81_09530 [Bacteroidetes bacterium]|nr:hypothetical protein [Bacteroidota bacterium]
MQLNKGNLSHILILFVILLSSDMIAQVRISSPYSYYGVGNLRSDSYNTVLMSMGGIRNAVNSGNMINIFNPATYIVFDSSTFLFEGGVLSSRRTLKNINTSENASYASLNHLLFGFPVSKRFKASFGIVPYSDVGYNILTQQYLTNIGKTQIQYEGNGGITQVFAGTAVKITKNLSLGANAFYNFGTIEKSRNIFFPDSIDTYINAQMDNLFRVGDFSFSFGMLYRKVMKNKQIISAGLTYSPQTRLKTRREYLANTFIGSYNGVEYFGDTVVYDKEHSGTITIPMQAGAGITLEMPLHWKIGIDFNWQEWSKYEAFGYKDSLKNSWSIAVGGEYIPDIDALRSYMKKIRYRLGFKYGMSNIYLRNNHLNEIGISFGFGLPVSRSSSMLNFGFEIGKFGTTNNNLIRENFVKFTLGITIHENWFIRSKYR